MMKHKCYTFFVASSDAGRLQKIKVPFYVVHLLCLLALVGCVTVFAAVGSYSRMLWKTANYNALRRDRDRLKTQYHQLQTEVKETNQRLSSLQSLASEVAVTYGIIRLHDTPFQSEAPTEPRQVYERTVDQFNFLVKNANAVAMAAGGSRLLLSGPIIASVGYVPSLWPVMGRITGSFGERLDPFSGEGAFHTGVDIGSSYGEPVRATAEGVVVVAETREGYGRLVVIDHGFGYATWYGHLSSFDTRLGARVGRGEVIGFVGTSGRATAPHVHYEVRIYNTPVNPWRYLRGSSGAD
jgi:murein DD-endopeptidase MepM/ murein hydrolase activator NlpD